MRKTILAGALMAAGIAAAGTAQAQTYDMKVASFLPPPHFMSKWLVEWGEELTEKSGGRIQVEHFPSAQMGPPPRYYDMARQGVAEVTFFLHGATPGRFPLTEIINLPYMVGSAEIGTKVLNDPDMRALLDPEHRGVKVLTLLTHQPGNVHTREKPVRVAADLEGLRIRFASATIKDWVEALGGTPVGLPPTEIAEGLQKGAIDGVFIDYGGAGIAFKLGPHLRYTTEMYSYVASFGVGMNPDFYDGLPADLKAIVDESVQGVAGEIGQGWDALDAIGKKLLMEAGVEPIELTEAELEAWRGLGAQLASEHIANLENDGKPAAQVFQLMKALSAKYEQESMSFWN